MNHPLMQILKFEYKTNRKMWIITSIVGLVLCILLYLIDTRFLPLIVAPSLMLPMVFTILSYQESTTAQSMSMYNLIPVSGSIKFFAKILITQVAFPVFLIILATIAYWLGVFDKPINTSGISLSFSFLSIKKTLGLSILIIAWFYIQSFSTLIAVVFKKYKLLWALLVYYGQQFLLMIPVIYLVFISHKIRPTPGQSSIDLSPWIIALSSLLVLTIFSISYRLFIKRKV